MPVADGILTFQQIRFAKWTIDHTQCGGTDSSNFTVLVQTTNIAFATRSNGGFMRFTNATDLHFSTDQAGTSLLTWEIESYNAVTGYLSIWVMIPTVSHTVDTVFFSNWGNPSSSSFAGGATGAAWDSNFVMVQHEENVASLLDSTAGGNNLTNNGTTNTTGKIDGGANFVRASVQYQTGGTNANLSPASITASCWINITNFNPFGYTATVGKDNATNYYSMLLITTGMAVYLTDNTGTNIDFDVATGPITAAGVWHYLSFSYGAGASLIGYIDGVMFASTAGTGNPMNNDATTTFYLGNSTFPARIFDGIMDEVRVSKSIRSGDWVLTEYNSMNNPGSFITLLLL